MFPFLNFWFFYHLNPLRRYFFSILYSDNRINSNNRIVCFPVDWGHKGMNCDHKNSDSDLIYWNANIQMMARKILKLFFRSVRSIWWYGLASMHLHYAPVFLFSYFEWHLQLCIRSRSEHLIVSIIFYWYLIYFELFVVPYWFSNYNFIQTSKLVAIVLYFLLNFYFILSVEAYIRKIKKRSGMAGEIMLAGTVTLKWN